MIFVIIKCTMVFESEYEAPLRVGYFLTNPISFVDTYGFSCWPIVSCYCFKE